MDIPPAKLQRRPKPAVVLADEFIAEILSLLTVKSLTRLRCASKSWNTLISDPTFVKLHLNRSARNRHLALMRESPPRSVVPFPVCRLLENPSVTLTDDPYYRLKDKDCCWVVGSCDGLICLLGCSITAAYRERWLYFWNPATRTISEKLGYFRDFNNRLFPFKFTFGYDNSSDTYKVVVWRSDAEEEYSSEEDDNSALPPSEVQVFSRGGNFWRIIQGFPVVPLYCTNSLLNNSDSGVYLSGTLNWLALPNVFSSDYDWTDIYVEQFVIVSLDLGTETYRQLLLPRGFAEAPYVEPTVGVLMDCLCFSHDFKGTDFAIWQMKEFGVEESWAPFLRISCQSLPLDIDGLEPHFQLLPLCLFENRDTLILASNEEDDAILYNWRDNRVERTRITNGVQWYYAMGYVESLVSTY